ncbi:MAG: hypothetical protein Kow0069_09950 [Promethearchaeota archaeon]
MGFGLVERNMLFNQNLLTDLLRLVDAPASKLIHLLVKRQWLRGERAVRYREVFVPTRDGAKMATDVFVPKSVHETRGKCPTVLVRTPYWKDTMAFAGTYLAMNGYAAVLQDVRGCAHSSPHGNNTFFFSEREDGFDALKWISEQYWFNGKVGMWGASYFGLTQWACSYARPPDVPLTCINPALASPRMIMASTNGLDLLSIQVDIARIFVEVTKYYAPVSQRKFFRERVHQYTEHMLLDPLVSLYNDPMDRSNVLVDLNAVRGMSLEQTRQALEKMLGRSIQFNRTDLRAFVDFVKMALLRGRANFFSENMAGMLDWSPETLDVPVLVFSGWYDMFSKSAMETWEAIQNSSNPLREKCKLIVGPWAHGAAGYPVAIRTEQGGWMDFIKALIPINWFAYWLKDEKDLDIYSKPPVRLFVMGKKRGGWRWEEKWPPERAVVRPLYLHSGGRANSRFGDGALSWDAPGESEPPDRYVFDPANPVLTRAGNNLNLPKGAVDQRPAENRRDVLVYTSAPLEDPLEICGNVVVVLHASTSAKDTDFTFKLCDVSPSGRSLNVLDLGVRARYRDGVFSEPRPVEPGRVVEYVVPIGPVAYYFKPKHRLRLDVTSSDFPKFNINSNLAGEGEPGTWVSALQRAYHDANHPSRVLLPVCDEVT